MRDNCNTCREKSGCKAAANTKPEMICWSYKPWHCCETCSMVDMCGGRFGNYQMPRVVNGGECDLWLQKPEEPPALFKQKGGKRGVSIRRAVDIINGERADQHGSPEDPTWAPAPAMGELPEGSAINAYATLENVLTMALDQAANGKGKERHAEDGEPFEKQQICEITRRVGHGFPLGQAVKKIQESPRLDGEHRINELLGAINYIAAAIIVEMD